MTSWASPEWLVVVVAAVVAFEAARAGFCRWRRRLIGRRRARRARRGEHEAESLLDQLGYDVLERQPRRTFGLVVDGRPHQVELRADLLVARRKRRFVAEVKTGRTAPRIETRATRRQLLEYRIAYHDVDGVLLVDAEAGEVHEVTFPAATRARQPFWTLLGGSMIGAVVGAAATWLLLGARG